MKKKSMASLGRLSAEQYRNAGKRPVILVLDNVRSALNVGSIFRTADAFRIGGIYLCGITAFPPSAEINKTALGATETVAWKHFSSTDDAIRELKEQGYSTWCVEQAEGAIPLGNFKIETDRKYAFIFGHELKGVDEKALAACYGCIEIPQEGMKHSLNVAVSAGIILWEFCRG